MGKKGSWYNISFLNLVTEAPKVDKSDNTMSDVVYFGENNLFPQWVAGLADNSALHGSALDKMALFIAGEGVTIESDNESRAEQALERLEEITGGLGGFHAKTCKDLAWFDGFGWQIHPLVGGEGHRVYFRDFTTVRAAKMAASDVEVSKYLLSNDWGKATGKKTFSEKDAWFKPEPIAAFDPMAERITEPVLLYHKGYKPGRLFYPEPTYMGGLRWIEIDAELSSFIKEDIRQGFTGNMHVHIFDNNAESEEKMSKIEGKIVKKFTTSEGQRIIVTYSLPGSEVPNIQPVRREANDKQMTFVEQTINKQILIADQVPARFMNMPIATGLGSESVDHREMMQVFQNTVIQPRQHKIEIEYDKLLKLEGFDDVKTKIKDLTPITFRESDEVMLRTRTVNEIRKLNNEEEIEGGDVFSIAPEQDGTS